jgi:hypothetical protein
MPLNIVSYKIHLKSEELIQNICYVTTFRNPVLYDTVSVPVSMFALLTWWKSPRKEIKNFIDGAWRSQN